MPRKPKPPADDPEQSKRFVDIAREFSADATKEEFERALKKLWAGRPKMPRAISRDRQTKPHPFPLRPGFHYWGARCHACGSPIPVGIATPDARQPSTQPLPNIHLQLVCVNAGRHRMEVPVRNSLSKGAPF
jgi:hypothetical protein